MKSTLSVLVTGLALVFGASDALSATARCRIVRTPYEIIVDSRANRISGSLVIENVRGGADDNSILYLDPANRREVYGKMTSVAGLVEIDVNLRADDGSLVLLQARTGANRTIRGITRIQIAPATLRTVRSESRGRDFTNFVRAAVACRIDPRE